MGNTPNEENWFSRLLSSRIGAALFYAIGAVLFSLFLGGLFWLPLGKGDGSFLNLVKSMFFMFSAPLLVMAVLVLITNIDRDGNWIYGIGCGLYYGTIAVASILNSLGLHGEDGVRFFVSFIIVSLICYIFYSKKHKKEGEQTMGLFTSGFEKAMYNELFDSPFNGYSSVSKVPLSDIIFDFCASIAHNHKIFPNGVEKKTREQVLYGSYALGTQLVGFFAPDGETDSATKAAFNGYKKTAINSGASQSLVSERLGLIMKCITDANNYVDQYGTDERTSEVAMIIIYLRMLIGEFNERAAEGLQDEINEFHNVFEQFMLAHP